MRIGFDARLFGHQHAGIGRYIQNLLLHLLAKPSSHSWVIAGPASLKKQLPSTNDIALIPTTTRHYSFEEQWHMPRIFASHQLDLVHIPHFNVPLIMPVPFVVTIHDILWHQFKGQLVTTLPPWLYHLKYLGYRLTTRQAVVRSKAIIVPSDYVRHQLQSAFPNLPKAKIKVIAEAVSPSISQVNVKAPTPIPTKPFLLYVGSPYPHKNLYTALQALSLARQQHKDLSLVISSARSIFLDRLEYQLVSMNLQSHVTVMLNTSDAQLKWLYQHALALIHPSLSEGFGLTALEAMSCGTPVIASNTTALPELIGQAGLLADPQDPQAFCHHILSLLNRKGLQQELSSAGLKRASHFSWEKAAEQTLHLYETSL